MKNTKLFFALSIFVAVIFIGIVISGVVQNLQKQNRNLEIKIDKLTLEVGKLSQNQIQTLGVEVDKSNEKLPAKKILGEVSTNENIITIPTPTPQPTPTPFKKVKKVASVNESVVSDPTPTPTPTPVVYTASVNIENLGNYTVNLEENDTAFSILLKAGSQNGFNIDYTNYEGLGSFVNCIGSVCAHDNYFWAFYFNNTASMVGASSQAVANGDITMWKFETW